MSVCPSGQQINILQFQFTALFFTSLKFLTWFPASQPGMIIPPHFPALSAGLSASPWVMNYIVGSCCFLWTKNGLAFWKAVELRLPWSHGISINFPFFNTFGTQPRKKEIKSQSNTILPIKWQLCHSSISVLKILAHYLLWIASTCFWS